jgi:uncharacterized protein (DUF1330 family)
MKANYKIALGVIGSFVLGLGVASVLHAQTKPLAYVLAEIDVKDPEGYKNVFLPKAQSNIKEHGGKYIAGGKALAQNGNPPAGRVVLLQFENMDAVKAYFEAAAEVDKSATPYVNSFRSFGIEGVEQK